MSTYPDEYKIKQIDVICAHCDLDITTGIKYSSEDGWLCGDCNELLDNE